jgi:putative phosphoribosyl transferase
MEKLIQIEVDKIIIEGSLVIPDKAIGLILFAHGSGSSRLSPRNNFVAKVLQEASFATLLIDLLTEHEDQNYATRFDIDFLIKRLTTVIDWLHEQLELKELPISLFGASTGAAAALKVAAKLGKRIAAVVSRGGRPDLAMDVLSSVVSPTLLIVGGKDTGVIELNQQAYAALTGIKQIEIIAGATHLFEEPGALEKVAAHAKAWFKQYGVQQ